jgi:AcrR family transcriptional regulator
MECVVTKSEIKARRGAKATSEAIIHAAAELFSKRGYDSASTRDIAEKAGVNVALINRYFGSKAGLFDAAIVPMLTIHGMIEGDMSGFGERVAAYYFGPLPDKTADPILAVLRSTGSAEIAESLRATLRAKFVDELAASLDGPDASARAAMIVMQIAGVDVLVRVLRVLPGDEAEREAIRERFAKSIQQIVDE